jgi:hypothetical protein
MNPRDILVQAAFVLFASTGSDYSKVEHLHKKVKSAICDPSMTLELAYQILNEIREELENVLSCEYILKDFTNFSEKCLDAVKYRTWKPYFDQKCVSLLNHMA